MTPFTIRTSLAALAFVACGTGAALAQDSPSPILDSVRVRQLVASEAPADQAALAAHFTALADRHASAARLHDGDGPVRGRQPARQRTGDEGTLPAPGRARAQGLGDAG